MSNHITKLNYEEMKECRDWLTAQSPDSESAEGIELADLNSEISAYEAAPQPATNYDSIE